MNKNYQLKARLNTIAHAGLFLVLLGWVGVKIMSLRGTGGSRATQLLMYDVVHDIFLNYSNTPCWHADIPSQLTVIQPIAQAVWHLIILRQ